MQIIVQEGKARLSLLAEMQTQDELLRATTVRELLEDVRVYYRDYELIRIEAREGQIEILPAGLAGLQWLERGRRYQLRAPNSAAEPAGAETHE